MHTSTIDWCEDNYVDFAFIAETWNTFSNIPFVLLALHGMFTTLTKGLPNGARYASAHAGIAFIGIGSFLFHATLMWHAQVLLDELPMIYVSCQAVYCILSEGKANSTRTLKITCTVIPFIITAIYLAYPNPLFHQVCYGVLQLFMSVRMHQLLQRLPAESRIKKDCEGLLKSGVVLSLIAFAIWNVDNIFCEGLTGWRGEVGSIGVLSQGHAWWHVLIALGTNRTMTGIIGVNIGLNDPYGYELAFRLKVFPYLRSVRSTEDISKKVE